MERRLLSFGPALLFANAVILAILLATAAFALSASYASYDARARQAAENVARTIAMSVASDVKQVDNALVSLQRQVAAAQAGGAGDAAFERIAQQESQLVPQVLALRLTDASGRVLGGEGAAAVSVADRDYFAAARSAPTRLAVSEPLKGRFTHKWGVVLARARTDAEGRFEGVAYANLLSEHFSDVFDDVSLGPNGAVTLRTSTLRLVARYTPLGTTPESAFGTSNVSAELRSALAAHPASGAFMSRTSIDGIERVNAYFSVDGFPGLVIVGLATDDFFRPWRRQALEMAGLCLLLEMVVLGLSLLVWLEHESVRRLATDQAALLDNELVGMVKLKDRLALWTNKALDRLFGYEPGELLGQQARLLYPDDESYERIATAYRELDAGRQMRTQIRMKRKDGSLLWIDLSGVRLTSGESLWMMSDISAVKDSESQARQMALRDPLTGLSNRYSIRAALEELLQQAQQRGTIVALCFIDLDGFKVVNDRHGHEAGDAVLREAARRIAACTRTHDFAGRIGGDEFVVALAHLKDAHEAVVVADRVLQCLMLPFLLPDGTSVTIGASLGVAMYPRHAVTGEALLARADEAMYVAKNGGKNRVSVSAAAA